MAIRTGDAAGMPGVARVFTFADLERWLKPLPVFGAAPPGLAAVVRFEVRQATQYALAEDRARHVGEIVAMVVADSRARAEDAVDRIEVEWEPLPPAADMIAAARPASPLVHPEWGTNVGVAFTHGIGDVDGAFAAADVAADVNRVAVVQDGPDWAHVRARMSASGLSPVPQFGSQARGLYDVLCVRERPGVDLLAARLREAQLEGHPVIVLYLARLDESLLLFLVGERDARLPVFLRCALPYSAVNPFTPALAGDVPPEMFYGRQDMVRELERPEGGCVVYGACLQCRAFGAGSQAFDRPWQIAAA